MTDAPQVANGRFARGFSCAQAIFSAFARGFGVSSELALRLSAPFGGGIAREGEVCGALTGALMVLGLQYGQDRPEGKEQTYLIAREFVEDFRRRHGAVRCSELVGHDISTAEGLEAARNANAFGTLCPVLVDETARSLQTYINDHPKP